jgi:hypothetical protein
MKKEILTPENHDWWDFRSKLSGLLNAHTKRVQSRNCRGNLLYTERILRTMPGIDFEGTINFLKTNYADCDCKILTLIS